MEAVGVGDWLTDRPDPSTPNFDAAQRVYDRLILEDTIEYETPGNALSRTLYKNLDMPWDASPPVQEFAKEDMKWLEWNVNGLQAGEEDFFLGTERGSLEVLGKRCATMSMVTRWREAHPELAHTQDDVIVKAVREFKELTGREEAEFGRSCVLILFKKR